MSEEAKRVINGTFSEIWLDDDLLAEATALNAKIGLLKEDVPMLGKASKGKKVVGWEGTGSVTINHVRSRMGKKLGQMIKDGKEVRCKIISKLADPDSYGTERVAVKDVLFDDLTLIAIEHGKPISIECPFTFEDYEYIDSIE